MKKVLIIGSKGMLGQELVRVFGADKPPHLNRCGGENYEVFGWDKLLVSDINSIDITDETRVKDKVLKLAPEIIINAAAYNAVDSAEEPAEFELAKKLNGLAPKFLAQAAKNLGAIFVHYSTDYVFDGQKEGGYKENDEPSPISNYGISKLMGEQEVKKVGGKYYIIRLQKLFGRPAQSAFAKKSFFETMLELARTKLSLAEAKKELEVVDEELANFTFAPDLAERTKWLVESDDNSINSPHHSTLLYNEREKSPLTPLLQSGELYPYGIYHITNEGAPVTWYGAAKVLFEIAGVNDVNLIPVSASRFPRPAKRPQYSILLNTKLPSLRPWPEALKEFLGKK